MTEQNQKQLGKTLWAIADQLRGAMNADDFRDYMLAFLFLRYLSVSVRKVIESYESDVIQGRPWQIEDEADVDSRKPRLL